MPKERDAKTRELCERIQKEFGRRLKALRSDRRMGQKALAPRMQLSRTSISNLECGLHLPSLDEVYRAAHCFGVPLEALLPPVEDVFPEAAVRTAADDPLSEHAASQASQIARDLVSHPSTFARKRTPSGSATKRSLTKPAAPPSRSRSSE